MSYSPHVFDMVKKIQKIKTRPQKLTSCPKPKQGKIQRLQLYMTTGMAASKTKTKRWSTVLRLLVFTLALSSINMIQFCLVLVANLKWLLHLVRNPGIGKLEQKHVTLLITDKLSVIKCLECREHGREIMKKCYHYIFIVYSLEGYFPIVWIYH